MQNEVGKCGHIAGSCDRVVTSVLKRYVPNSFEGNEEDIPSDVVTKIAAVTNGLVGFLLSMYVSDALARWWTVREEKLGGLFAAIDMINMALHLRHRSGSPYDQWLIEQYGRY